MAASKATGVLSGALSNLQISAPVLDDLMKWHVYIGYIWDDREPVEDLHTLLRSKELTCSLRSSLDVKEQAQEDNIKQGIVFSHKCLLYISPDYLKDPWSKHELKEAEKKLKFLGENSVLGIVQSNVKDEQLGGYKQFQRISLSDGQTMQECLSNSDEWGAFVKDYELKTELSLVPKENIGVGVAYTYFFGYLQIVVPGIWENFEKEMEDKRVEKKFLLKRMLIIIRKSVNPPPKLQEPGVEQTKFNFTQVFARSGKDRREYTLSVYKLAADEKDESDYYFIADFPACLFALREALDQLNTNMKSDEVFEARNEFVLTVKALLNHPDNQPSFGNQWELLLWPDEVGNHRIELSDFLRQQIKSKRLTELLPHNAPIPPVRAVGNEPTFTYEGGTEGSAIYSDGEHYNLKDSKRGYCVIINNCYFLKNLKTRDGASEESDILKKLFEELQFEVRRHTNLAAVEMKSELTKYSEMDHSDSDAFVCCLLSHGSKGRIFGSDGDSVSIVELMEPFYDNKCPKLKGKPKLFFVGSCQESVAEDKKPDTKPETNLQSTSAESVSPGDEPGLSSDDLGVTETLSPKSMKDLIPPTVDFIVSYACLPNTVSLRHPKDGGLYVQALCKYLNRNLEIDIALRRVNREVKRLWDDYTRLNQENKKPPRPDPFHIIMPPQKFLFLKKYHRR